VLAELKEVDFSGSGPPKYERLKSCIASAISAGRLRPGDALPPEKVLAVTLGIARNTVRQALQDLEQSGLLKRDHGKGTFVSGNALRRIRDGFENGLNLYALVVPEAQSGLYASLLHGFDEAAYQLQHQVIVCSTGNDLDKQAQVILSLMDKRVAGVTIVPATAPPTPAYHIRQLQKHGIPVVLCHRGVEGVQAPLLSMPFREIGCCAAEAAVKLGHRRAALISSVRTESTIQFERGLRETFAAASGSLPDPFVIFDDRLSVNPQGHERELFVHLERLCCHPNRPTVIFTSFDPLAETVYLLLRRFKLRLPEDMSIVSFGDSRREGAIIRRLSSVVIDQASTARKAASLLDEIGRGQREITNDESFLLPVQMGEGMTLGLAYNVKARR
jgi:DNA-binding LacI/PurR family transcriptional regulator